MNLVESHIIKPSHKDYQELDHLLFLAKNLYNTGLYEVRQHFFKAKENPSIKYKYLNYYTLNALLKGREDENYRALPANASQEVLKLINQNFCSFFKTLSMKRERLMTNKISIPKYLDSSKGRQILIYNQMTIGKVLLKQGIIQLPKTKIQIKTRHPESLRQVRVVPKNSYIVIEVVYEVQEKEILKDNNRFLTIDLGINNLATCSSNVIEPFIIDGRKPSQLINFIIKEKLNFRVL